ncbi:hypothetical protein ACFP2T_00395 [Plantactinospora solaniradicis]|uniref:Teneurin NHL domain-containing protein n=1 Tax=Plantactinospora solaniradicis TaxID=1723736 RepID=A0ABW1K0B2_9ACTN
MLPTHRLSALLTALTISATLIPPTPAYADQNGLDVFAGTGTAGATGDGGPASAALLNHPTGVAVAGDGTVYISDGGNRRVRRVAPDGTISTVAGTGRAGTAGDAVPDGTPGDQVDLLLPQSLAVGSDNTLYISDPGLYRIFRLSPDGRLSVFAGTGVPGLIGDGGPAIRASFGQLGGLAVAPDGTVYIGDLRTHRVRAVSPAGEISTVAGNGNGQITAAGGPATTVALPNPSSLSVDAGGAVWIGTGLTVHRLSGGKLATVTLPDQPDGGRWGLSEAATWPLPESPLTNVAAVSAVGDQVYLLDQQSRTVLRLGTGDALETVAALDSAEGPVAGPVAVAAAGAAYLVDNASHRVYSFRPTAPRPDGPDGPDGPDDGSSVPWWPFAVAGALVIAIGAWLFARRRRAH